MLTLYAATFIFLWHTSTSFILNHILQNTCTKVTSRIYFPVRTKHPSVPEKPRYLHELWGFTTYPIPTTHAIGNHIPPKLLTLIAQIRLNVLSTWTVRPIHEFYDIYVLRKVYPIQTCMTFLTSRTWKITMRLMYTLHSTLHTTRCAAMLLHNLWSLC